MWYAIILAGGSGSRMAAKGNKVLLSLQREEVILRSARAFDGLVDGTVIVSRQEDKSAIETLFARENRDVIICCGGSTRQESVRKGLDALPADCTHVLIHDGARCLVDEGTIQRVKNSVLETGAAAAALPCTDTIKVVDDAGLVVSTPDRNTLQAMQTPQGFTLDLLKAAYAQADKDGFTGTDDASLVERIHPVQLVLGDRRNLKLTTPEDMIVAQAYLQSPAPLFRIGQGYDVHRLVEGRKLILCGVDIPHTTGLLGHSDADVALHALMDAMLGAMALGDIGKHFPDTDPAYKGISSMKLLEHVTALLKSKGAHIVNCDVTIVAQKPKLLPFIPQMRQNIADTLGVDVSFVNVKATTTEKLNFEGREEGISAQAVCMVQVA